MSALRAAMIAGACAAVAGVWSTEAKAELHRFAFRGQVGDIPAELAVSPQWAGISPGDPMLISCVVDTPDEVITYQDLDGAALVSVSVVIGGRLETTDGVGSTIRASLEEGIARADVAGAHNKVELDLVLPSGVRVHVQYPVVGGLADWSIGDASGQIRLTAVEKRDQQWSAGLDPVNVDPTLAKQLRAAWEDAPNLQTPSPAGVALLIPAMALVGPRRRR